MYGLCLRILLQETYEVQDCRYWNTSEVTRTTTNGSTIYDNNMSELLPTNCEISFDMWSNHSASSGEHRFFFLPKSQYNSGTTQPSYALYIDQLTSSKINAGKRENSSSQGIGFTQVTATTSTYHTIKFVKNATSISIYVDDVFNCTVSLSWIDNYTDYCFSMMRWSTTGTTKIKNVKIKAL